MKKKILLLFIVAVVFSQTAFGYSMFKMPSGQTVIVEEMPENPIVTIDTWIKTGSINETDANSGVSHFLEHLFFKGTNSFPTGAFDKILESKGAINNAATSKDFTHYYITIPSKDFETALQLHADMLLNPLIPRKELEMERKVVLEEIARSKDTPDRILFNNMISILYKNHPYHREVLGSDKVIETISREEILDYYNKFYIPSNMVTIVVGDVKTDNVKQMIDKYFVTDKKNKVPVVLYRNDKPLAKQTQKIEKADVKNGYMIIGFRGVNAQNTKDSYALDVLATILGDGKTSRFYQEIKDKKQLAISIASSHASYKQDSLFAIKAHFNPENMQDLKNAVFSQIEKIKNEPISEQELEKAKKIIERDTYYSRESVSNIANEIGYISVIYDSPKMYDTYISQINKVTSDDVQRVAKKYLNPSHAAISILLPEKINIEQPKEVRPVNIQPKSTQKGDNYTKYTLENGAKLIIEQNKSNDIIAIKIYSLGGHYVFDKPGTASITAASMMKGTKQYSAYELSELMEEKGIKISPTSSPDAFSISLKVTKNELKDALNLLNEILNNATFSSYEVEKVKNDKLASIKQNRDNPFSLTVEEFKTKIWEGNPYGTTGKILEKTIPTITMKDITNFYGQIFAPENVVISVNGNVEGQDLINYFSKLFENKKYKKVKISDYKTKNKPIDNKCILNVNKDTQTAWIMLGWQTAGNDSEKDFATLQVIDSILGTGMSSRLFVNLRDEQGLAYQIGSFYLPNINHGLFGVYIGTNPKNYTVAKNDIFKEIQKLKTQFVSDNELKEAKDKLLGHYLLGKETNMEKAGVLGWYEVSGRGADFDAKYPALINSVTVEDIISTANKYFNDKYVMTVVAPQKELK